MPPSDRRIVRRHVRRFRNQREAYRKGEMTLEEMGLSVQSWIAHLILEAVMEPGQQGERLDQADRLPKGTALPPQVPTWGDSRFHRPFALRLPQ